MGGKHYLLVAQHGAVKHVREKAGPGDTAMIWQDTMPLTAHVVSIMRLARPIDRDWRRRRTIGTPV